MQDGRKVANLEGSGGLVILEVLWCIPMHSGGIDAPKNSKLQ